MRAILFSLLFLFWFLPHTCHAQNLVPNPSFEDTIGCPDGILGGIEYTRGWYSAERALISSPDLFVNCGGSSMVPQNAVSFQYASTGNAYAGIITWTAHYFDTIYDLREFIGIKLSAPLVIGLRYYVAFKINAGIGFQSAYSCNKIGLLLSTVKHDITCPPPINNTAHIYTNQIITDTLNWTLVSGWLVADSAYEYLCIGNFFQDSITSIQKPYPNTDWNDSSAYYFIDDVCVTTDSNQCLYNLTNSSISNSIGSDFSIYPNPVSDVLHIRSSPFVIKSKLTIYDALGQEVIKGDLKGGINNIRTNNIEDGIYFLQISDGEYLFLKTIIVNH